MRSSLLCRVVLAVCVVHVSFIASPVFAERAVEGPTGPVDSHRDPTALCSIVAEISAVAASHGTPFPQASESATVPHELLVAGAAWSSYPTDPGGSRIEGSAMFDPTRNRIVVFGGVGASGLLNDVRVLDLASGSWSTLAPSGTAPAARCGHSAVYDVVRDRMIVFGGGSQLSYTRTDVWVLTFAGTPAWSQLSPSGTPPSSYGYTHRAIYDVVRDRLVVVDALGSGKALSLGTSPAWTTLSVQNYPVAGGFGMAALYDQPRDRILAFGGFWDPLCGPIPYYNSISELRLDQNPLHWDYVTVGGASEPSQRAFATLVRDPGNDVALVFGGNYFGVFGGGSSGTNYNDVWQLTLGSNPSWTQLSTTGTSPAVRSFHAAAFAPSSRRMVVVGGQNSGGGLSDIPALDRTDVVPPANVGDFNATVRCEAIDFGWTAPGDDGMTGNAQTFEIRKSTTAALTNSTWNSGTYVGSGASAAPGTNQTWTYEVGACSQRAYYAVRVVDASGNWNSVSNGTGKIGTPCIQPPMHCMDLAPGALQGQRLELAVRSNPARGPVTIEFDVSASEDGTGLDLSVFDVTGRRLEQLAAGPAVVGPKSIRWDLTQSNGVRVPHGIYFVRLQVGNRTVSRPLVVT